VEYHHLQEMLMAVQVEQEVDFLLLLVQMVYFVVHLDIMVAEVVVALVNHQVGQVVLQD